VDLSQTVELLDPYLISGWNIRDKSTFRYPAGDWVSSSDSKVPTLNFGDLNLSIVEAPGHLPRHINLQARIASDPS